MVFEIELIPFLIVMMNILSFFLTLLFPIMFQIIIIELLKLFSANLR